MCEICVQAFRQHHGNDLVYEAVSNLGYPTRPSSDSAPENSAVDSSSFNALTTLLVVSSRDSFKLHVQSSKTQQSSFHASHEDRFIDRNVPSDTHGLKLSDSRRRPELHLNNTQRTRIKKRDQRFTNVMTHVSPYPPLKGNRSLRFIYANISTLNSRELSVTRRNPAGSETELIKEQMRQAKSKRKRMEDKVWLVA